MATFVVSTVNLREKARAIQALLAESKANHAQLWSQMSTQASMLPRDLMTNHVDTNNPWNSATLEHYDNHHQLAVNMGLAADGYEKEDQDVKSQFDSL